MKKTCFILLIVVVSQMTIHAQSVSVPDASVYFSGTTGTTPVSGGGTRLMWIPAKAAFRAGEVLSNQWDDVNIGLNSFVGGGLNNLASGLLSFSGGGTGNNAIGDFSFIGGGGYNFAIGDFSFIGGGSNNNATGETSFIGSGYQNTASGLHSAIIGGEYNSAQGLRSAIIGGQNNSASGQYSAITGGLNNQAVGTNAFVGGGSDNLAGVTSFIGGGYQNNASGESSAIIGGQNNSSSGIRSAIIGGQNNSASGQYSAITGGWYNQTMGIYACVGGGLENSASGAASFIGGGVTNNASGEASFIGGGDQNNATGAASFIGGRGLFARSFSEVAVGLYNTNYTPQSETEFHAADRLFVVGNGTDANNRSNAIVVYKNANVELSGKILNEAVQATAFFNGWQNYGAPYGNAGYYKDKEGRVHLNGVVKNGSSGHIMTLPVGYRPNHSEIFTTVRSDTFSRIDVFANGQVVVQGNIANNFVSLSGISFRAAE